MQVAGGWLQESAREIQGVDRVRLFRIGRPTVDLRGWWRRRQTSEGSQDCEQKGNNSEKIKYAIDPEARHKACA